jgi:hypothetical protein
MLQALSEGPRGIPSPGFYGFLALLAIAAPFIHHFWKDKRAALGGLLPLPFMVIVWIMIRSSIGSSMGGGGRADGPFGDAMKQAREEIMKAISFGFGTYLSFLVSLYFAAMGTKQFLAAKASR